MHDPGEMSVGEDDFPQGNLVFARVRVTSKLLYQREESECQKDFKLVGLSVARVIRVSPFFAGVGVALIRT